MQRNKTITMMTALAVAGLVAAITAIALISRCGETSRAFRIGGALVAGCE